MGEIPLIKKPEHILRAEEKIAALHEAEQYKQIGNAVAVHMGEWIGRELIRYFN